MLKSSNIGASLCSLILLTAISAGNPFTPPYSPSVGYLHLSGDLKLSIPVAKAKIGDANYVDIYLDHRMEVLDYGDVKSSLILRPFESGVFERPKEFFCWLAPNGTQHYIEKASIRESGRLRNLSPLPILPEEMTPLDVMRHGDSTHRFFSGNGGSFIFVESGAWGLFYNQGLLRKVYIPEGRELSVKSIGTHITAWKSHIGELLTIIRSQNNLPEKMIVNGNSFGFVYQKDGLLIGIHDNSGKNIYSFQYDVNNLLNGVTRRDGYFTEFSWARIEGAKRGDSAYAKPFHLSAAGEIKYQYSAEGDIICLRQVNSDGHVIRMTVRHRNGIIVHLKEEHSRQRRWLRW